jgi:hypothetical protein
MYDVDVRRLPAIAAILLCGCASSPPPPAVTKALPDPVSEEWYGRAVRDLTALNEETARSFRAGRADAAGETVSKGQPLAKRLLEVPRPSLAAMEAASDLDDAYGRILLAKHNAGWARMVFQKNVVRWTAWKPQTEESARRRKEAAAKVAECERAIAAQ